MLILPKFYFIILAFFKFIEIYILLTSKASIYKIKEKGFTRSMKS